MPDVKIKKDGQEYGIGVMPQHYPADRVYLDGDTSKTVQDELFPQSETEITVRAVFGNNNSSGVCVSSMIPLLLADSCNITINDMTVVGTSTHIDLTKIIVGNKTKYGFAIACGDYANVQNKTVTVTYSYTRA